MLYSEYFRFVIDMLLLSTAIICYSKAYPEDATAGYTVVLRLPIPAEGVVVSAYFYNNIVPVITLEQEPLSLPITMIVQLRGVGRFRWQAVPRIVHNVFMYDYYD